MSPASTHSGNASGDIRSILKSAIWKKPVVTAGDDGEIPHIRFRQVGQKILEFDLERQTTLTHPYLSHRLTAIRV